MSTPQVGDSARRSRTISQRDIELFTEITGDRNPIHYDEEVAAASRFGGLVAQGGVTSGLLNALVAEQLPGPGSVFLEVNWRFLAPVRPGDEITAEATVLEAREDKPIVNTRSRLKSPLAKRFMPPRSISANASSVSRPGRARHLARRGSALPGRPSTRSPWSEPAPACAWSRRSTAACGPPS